MNELLSAIDAEAESIMNTADRVVVYHAAERIRVLIAEAGTPQEYAKGYDHGWRDSLGQRGRRKKETNRG